MKILRSLFVLFSILGAASGSHAQVPAYPCTRSANVGFQIPNIGNTTNWGTCLNYDLNLLDTLLGGAKALQLNSATPNVAGSWNWYTANTTTVTITNLLGAYPGQTVRLYCGIGDVSTSVATNSNFNLGASWSCATSKSISLAWINGVWIETGRWGGGGGGGGGVSSVSAGNLSGLFSTTVNNPTTTPLITFSPVSALAYQVYGNCTGSVGSASFCTLNSSMIPTIPLATGVSGTLPHSSLPTLLSGDIPNNAANTSGTAALAVTLTGTLAHNLLPTLLSSDIPNNAANTSGNSATTSALSAAPTKCLSTQASIGIDIYGNAQGCWTPSSAATLAFTNLTSGTAPNTTAMLVAGSLGPTGAGTVTANAFSGNLPVTNLNGGSGATSSTFWNGAGVWAVPAGGGNISNSGSPAQYQTVVWVSGTLITGVGPGTSGYPLVSAGSGANPSYAQLADAALISSYSGTGSCSANQFVNVTSRNASPGCAQVTFSGLFGSASVGQLPSTTVNSITNDTNVTGSIAAQVLTLGWTGTLAAARLNANVVQGITNDTNVTGSIVAQNLTLGWTGTLAGTRGGWGQAFPTPTRAGDIHYYNGSSWVTLAGNNAGTLFLQENSSGVPAWVAPNLTTSGSPTQFQTAVWSSSSALTGVGPGSSGLALVSGGASANPSYALLTDTGLTSAYSGTGACSSNQYVNTLTRNATPTCSQVTFSQLSGTASSGQLPSSTVEAITNDTNVTGSITAQNLTLGWTGTLASGRLNANVVQAITNDTNITGSITAQNLTLAWSGTLASGRLNANVVQSITNDTNVTGSIATQALTLGWTGTLAGSRGGWGQALPTPTRAGDVFYYNGTSWASLAGNNTGTQVFTENSSGVPSWASSGSGVVSSGTINGLAYYTASTTVGSTTPPTVNGFYVCGYNVTGSAAVAPTCTLQGIPVVASPSSPLTAAANITLETFSSTSTTAITGPGLANNIAFVLANLNSGLVTYTPASGTVNGNATQIIPEYWYAFEYTNNTNTFMPVFPTIQAFPNCSGSTCALQFNTATGAFSAGTINTITSLTTGIIPKAASSTTLGNSALDDGVTTANTLTYTGSAGISAKSFITTGSTAGFLQLGQGSTNSVGTTAITIQAPSSVTSYILTLPGTAATGLPIWTNSAGVVTEAITAPGTNGTLLVSNGTAWTTVVGNASGTKVLQEDASGNASWVVGGGGSGTVNSGTTPRLAYYASSTTAVSDTGANLTWVSPDLTIGVAGTTTGQLTLASSTATGSITLQPEPSSTNTTLSLPTGTAVLTSSASVPSWLAAAATSTAGVIAITANTGQTAHQVIGTCNTATTFGPCSLVTGDLPTVAIAQGGLNATSAGSLGMIPNTSSTTASAWTVTPTLGSVGVSTGTLTLASSGSGGGITLTPGVITSAYTLTLPAVTGPVAAFSGSPAGGKCLQSSGTLGIIAETASACSGGSNAWSALTAPQGTLSITMPAGDITTFTWATQASPSTSDFAWVAAADSGTSTTSIFAFYDTTGNLRTGPLLDVHTVGTSTALPVRLTAQGTANGVSMSTAGLLSAIGTGGINATELNGNTFPASAGYTAGGILYASSTSAVASSGILTQYGVVFGGGAGNTPTSSSAGTQYELLWSGGTGNPGWSPYTMPATVAAGGIPYASSSSAITTLASTGYSVLASGATNPTWITPTGNSQCLMSAASSYATTTPGFAACPSATTLTGLGAATAGATIANGNYGIVWNWALGSGPVTGFTIGETTAASTSGDILHQITTLTTSYAIPLQITQGAAGPAGANAPAVFNISAAATGGTPTASAAGTVGAPIGLMTGAGSAGGATTGTGGTGGAFTLTVGAGGTHGGNTANAGGAGGAITFTMGAGASGAATGAGGAAGAFTYSGAVGGAGGSTSGTGGVGSDFLVNTGTGGAATAGSTTGRGGNAVFTLGSSGGTGTAGAPGQFEIVAGTVGAALTTPFLNITGTWNTSGVVDAALFMNITNTASGTASKLMDLQVGGASVMNVDKSANLTLTGSTAGFLQLGQGSTNSTGTTAVTFQAPTSVTSYVVSVPGAAPTNNNSAMLVSNASPGVGSWAKMPQIGIMTSAQSSLTSLTNLTGLSFSVEANTNYVMSCMLYYQVSATTNNLIVAITGPSTPTGVTYSFFDPNTATAIGVSAVATAFASTLSGAGTSVATTNLPATITMGLRNGANAGTVQVQAGSTGTGSSTVQAQSWCQLQ